MGKKPADRGARKTPPLGAAQGFDSTARCGCCGAASRAVRPQWRVCANGHPFIKKSDQRATRDRWCRREGAPGASPLPWRGSFTPASPATRG